MNQIRGIYAPILTPFNADQTINWESLELHLERLIQARIHGIFALGSTSEALFLPIELKKELVYRTLKFVGNRTPVIVQTGCNVLADTIELSTYALDSGAQALSIITPYYYPLDEQSLLEYYSNLSHRLPEVPICVYNFPSRTGNDIHPELLAKCQQVAPNIVAIKESSESIERFAQLVRENPTLSILAGTNSLILQSLDRGCQGAVATLANVVPEALVKIYEHYHDGQVDLAQELQTEINKIRACLKSLGPDLQIYKVAASVFGSYPFTGMYPPHRNLTATELESATRKIEELKEDYNEKIFNS